MLQNYYIEYLKMCIDKVFLFLASSRVLKIPKLLNLDFS